MEAEQRKDLIALIEKVRNREPIQVDASVALRMITVRVEEGIEGLPVIKETDRTLEVFCDILEIIKRVDATDVVGDGPGPWGDVDDFCGR